MRVVLKLWVPTKRSRDILQQAKGIIGIESTQMVLKMIRRGRLVGQSSAEAKSLKTKGQGTVRLPPQWATAKAARLGDSGPNKRATLMTYLLKKKKKKKKKKES